MKTANRCTIVSLTNFRKGINLFSASLRITQRSWQLKKDGTADILLQVIIDRQVIKISTGLSWPPQYFDKGQGLCKPRWKGDSTANDQNIEIRQCITKANEIFFHYRTNNIYLTLDQFRIEYQNYYNRANFIDFMEAQRNKQLRAGIITKGTAENHRQTINLLKRYSPNMLMIELRKTLPKEFDAWMKKQGFENVNTRFKHHRVLRTYVNHAINEGFHHVPKIYQGFTFKETPSKISALDIDELRLIVEYYELCPEGTERKVLRRFLWSCFTGMRISDQRQFNPNWLIGNRLIFMPQKTRGDQKQVNVPLPPTAMKIFEEELREAGPDEMFKFPTPQAGNRILKDVGTRLGIQTHLCSHVGRKTCVTLIVKHFKDIHAAKEYLNHSSIKTTMKYDNVDDERKTGAANVLEKLIGGMM